MILSIIFVVVGLCIFETVSSIDNAIINAEVLTTMGKPARRWFLSWGLIIAVILVRGLLPWAIVWAVNPALGPLRALTAAFSGDVAAKLAVDASAPYLLLAGGIFLLFLFFHWLFMEPKELGLPRTERFFLKQNVWFYAIASLILLYIGHRALAIHPMLAFAALIGSSAFFITHGFKQNAEASERSLMTTKKSDLSKLFYLEIIDGIFSIDSVLGAFAFTLSVPLILLGNGLGAFLVRKLTMGNIERIKKYKYLKNGAMYSIFVLGLIMVLSGFGVAIPEYVSPAITIIIIGYFFYRSVRAIRAENKI